MCQIRALGSQFVQNHMRNKLNWQLDVPQGWPETDRNHGEQRLQGIDV